MHSLNEARNSPHLHIHLLSVVLRPPGGAGVRLGRSAYRSTSAGAVADALYSDASVVVGGDTKMAWPRGYLEVRKDEEVKIPTPDWWEGGTCYVLYCCCVQE